MAPKVLGVERALLPMDEAEVALDATRQTIMRWESQGIIRVVRIGRRVYVPTSEIERLAAGQ